MRTYRYPTSIAWSKPDPWFRRIEAETAHDALKQAPSHIRMDNMQILFGGSEWRWVSDVAEHNGGVAKHWHGERY